MIPELGHLALIIVFALSLTLGSVPLMGAARGSHTWMRSAFSLSLGVLVFAAVAFGCLVNAFVNDDFSVRYVATNSNSLLPTYYKVAATWGAHEGSFLLWILIMAGWTAAVATFSRHLPMITRVVRDGPAARRVCCVLVVHEQPAARTLPLPPAEGADLNPLLQDF